MSLLAHERPFFSQTESQPSTPVDSAEIPPTFHEYLYPIVANWLRVLAVLGIVLVPLFSLLDWFIAPPQLFWRFAAYRAVTTAILVLEYVLIRSFRPGAWNNLHGYAFTLAISAMITHMTVDLGGFDSSYYAGINLVIIAVNMLLSWSPVHSLVNGCLSLSIYVGLNLLSMQGFETRNFINNMYFVLSTIVITVSISWVRYRLVHREYHLRSRLVDTNRALERSRQDVVQARDRLWGEMQLARLIQSALLPDKHHIGHYESAAIMLPTDVVGGDYYDLIEADGTHWVAIGDVSGHGVDSGLLMMMAQTSLYSVIQARPNSGPAEVLIHANRVLKDNIQRMGAELYFTVLLMRLEADRVVYAGKHTDWLLYRAGTAEVEMLPTVGTWLGITDDLDGHLHDSSVAIGRGDIIMLFTDGITESRNAAGEFFGEERLALLLEKNAREPIKRIGQSVLDSIMTFSPNQTDDISLVLLRNRGYATAMPR